MIENIEVELAIDILLKKTKAMPSEIIKIEEALDRILYNDFKSRINIPNFRKSALDGFALNYEDTEDIEEKAKAFKIHGYIGAGSIMKMVIKKIQLLK